MRYDPPSSTECTEPLVLTGKLGETPSSKQNTLLEYAGYWVNNSGLCPSGELCLATQVYTAFTNLVPVVTLFILTYILHIFIYYWIIATFITQLTSCLHCNSLLNESGHADVCKPGLLVEKA